MRIINAEFVKGAVSGEQFPYLGVPEFAFFGRSNAGKSSLINMLVNRKNLVKTGSRPGMTREINFFFINKPAGFKIGETVPKNSSEIFAFIDLPGYGYAKRSGKEMLQIDKMLYDYCTNRPLLKALFFLMDIRREPSEVELNSIAFFHKLDIEVVIVATKADKIGKNEQINIKRSWVKFFNFDENLIVPTSTLKKIGREQILNFVESRCNLNLP